MGILQEAHHALLIINLCKDVSRLDHPAGRVKCSDPLFPLFMKMKWSWHDTAYQCKSFRSDRLTNLTIFKTTSWLDCLEQHLIATNTMTNLLRPMQAPKRTIPLRVSEVTKEEGIEREKLTARLAVQLLLQTVDWQTLRCARGRGWGKSAWGVGLPSWCEPLLQGWASQNSHPEDQETLSESSCFDGYVLAIEWKLIHFVNWLSFWLGPMSWRTESKSRIDHVWEATEQRICKSATQSQI